MDLIREELGEIRAAYGDDRRTEITHSEDDLDIEDLIADQQMVITITKSGYIKSLPAGHLPHAAPRRQGRHRDGHEGRRLHRAPVHLLDARLPAVLHQPRQGLPVQGLRAARGLAHGQGPRAGQRAAAARRRARPVRPCATRDFSEHRYLVFATRRGQIKKTEMLAYNTPIKADGIIAINIRDDDELVAVRGTSGDDDIIMVSRSGQAAKFSEDQVRSMGRDTSGVRGMNVGPEGQPRAGDGHRPPRPGPARRHRERLRQAHGDGRLPAQGPRQRWASRRSR